MAKTLQAAYASSQQISLAGVSNASALAALESAAAKAGWTGAQWTALFNVEMREAGFSTSATNPSSGAFGMAQFINGPSEYALYGGNATTSAGQAVAMVNYIKSRYGNPEAAWLHEQQFGWYGKGGTVPYSAGGMISEPVFGTGAFSGLPYSFAENGPEQVIPGGAAMAPGSGLPGLTQYQGSTLIQLLQQQNKMLAQMPYSQAAAMSGSASRGLNRGYHATSG
jgi:SLT domain-containing protein